MSLKRLVRRSLWLTCAYYLYDDWRAGRRLARGRLETRSGRRHAALDLDQSLGYIDRVHDDYLRYGGIERFEGVVVEIGPGDNLGVALRMLADGAREVHAIDRYVPARDPARQRRIYEELAARPGIAALFDGAPEIERVRNLHYHPGVPAERFFADVTTRFDAIVSRAVLEHLYDPLAALDDMARALKPGGVMIHRIDLRDHGMFAGRHPLTHLTMPPWLYRRMTRNAGRPNRVLMPAYRDWLARAGLDGSVKVSRLAGIEGEIEPVPIEALEPAMKARAIETVRTIRPRLAAPFRALDDEMLAVSGLVLVARKARLDQDTRKTH
ncbi:MAG: methyltransferase domain-containing protein [Alphaproteobacteria bacterium]